jgi:glycine cleavage system aminomethyltransferase T
MPKDLKRTALYSWHKEHGGQMIEFAGRRRKRVLVKIVGE